MPRIHTIISMVGLCAGSALAQSPAAEPWVVVKDPAKLERNVLWSPGTSAIASLPASWSEAVAGWHGRKIMVSATSPFTEEGREVLKLREPVRVAALLRGTQPVWIVAIEAGQAKLERKGGGPTLTHPLAELTVGEPAAAGVKLSGKYKGTRDELDGPLTLADRHLVLIPDHPRSFPFVVGDLTVEVEGVEASADGVKELFVEQVLRPGSPQAFSGTLSFGENKAKERVVILEQAGKAKSAVFYPDELDPLIAALKKLPQVEVRAYAFPEDQVLLAVGFKVEHPTHGAVWARFMEREVITGRTLSDGREVTFRLGEVLEGINLRLSGR